MEPPIGPCCANVSATGHADGNGSKLNVHWINAGGAP